jgi:16S rRNA (guanine(1405)-N(7))-methyltransferase
MLKNYEEALETLVNDVLSSPKYKYICPDLVRGIGSQELQKRRNRKEALKATKNKLHQIGGAYFDGREDYRAWLDDLASVVQTCDQAQLQRVCWNIMQHHASTRERLPILSQFYTTILADLAPIHSILDVACGLNPLSIPWLPLAENGTYYACDIYQHLTDFLNQYLHIMHIQGYVQTCDVIQSCPEYEVDVAFVLKTIPCLEQVDKHFGYRLLRAINARYLVVSFPVHSLSGRSKGMATYYESHFRELLGDETWEVRKFEFASELVFVVKK